MTAVPRDQGEQRKWLDRRPTLGSVAWIVQRVAGVALLVLVPLKVLGGWAFRQDIPFDSFLVRMHLNGAVDVALITAVAFHAVFGVRTVLIDVGLVRTARVLTIPLIVFASLVTIWGSVIAL